MGTVALHPAMKPERDFLSPPVISVMGPDGKANIDLIVSPTTIQEYAKAQRKVPLLQVWSHLVGEMPPLNNAYHYPQSQYPDADIRSIQSAVACFKGVNRPLNKEDDGENVYVYVFTTPQTVIWKPGMACMVAIADSPPNTVFTVHVRSSDALQDAVGDVWGAITKWEFVGADAERPTLPKNYRERYGDTLWDREG